jgi:regulator of replication initiation timing
MKLNFTIEINSYDEHDLQEEIVDRASSLFISNILGSGWDKNDLYKQLERNVIEKLENIMDVDFKQSVSEKVTENLVMKFEKTKQYKDLLNGQDIVTDNVIKTGLRSMVSDIVKSEIKKIFNG